MNPDDNFQRIRTNLKISTKGVATFDITSENLVQNAFETKNTKSAKMLENVKTTVSETFEAYDEMVKQAHERGLKVAGADTIE